MASEQQRSVESLPENVKAQAVEAARPAVYRPGDTAQNLMDKATQHRPETSGGAGSREAQMHLGGHPERAQEALSPTDAGKSQTALQGKTQGRGRGIER